MQGNPFSPAYFAARHAGAARARDFSAVNVAIYGPNGKHWSLREGTMDDDCVYRDGIVLGRSSLCWERDALVVRIDQRTTPLQRPLVGTIRFMPGRTHASPRTLDAAGRHEWCPIAPSGRVEVHMKEPGLSFRGSGYHDANRGDEGLEEGFRSWTWARATSGARTNVDYVAEDVFGNERKIHIGFDDDGALFDRLPPPRVGLSKALWGVSREAFGARAPDHVVTLEDGPFYARSLLRTGDSHAVHETLDAQRLRRGWVRFLTPFRMGRLG